MNITYKFEHLARIIHSFKLHVKLRAFVVVSHFVSEKRYKNHFNHITYGILNYICK